MPLHASESYRPSERPRGLSYCTLRAAAAGSVRFFPGSLPDRRFEPRLRCQPRLRCRESYMEKYRFPDTLSARRPYEGQLLLPARLHGIGLHRRLGRPELVTGGQCHAEGDLSRGRRHDQLLEAEDLSTWPWLGFVSRSVQGTLTRPSARPRDAGFPPLPPCGRGFEPSPAGRRCRAAADEGRRNQRETKAISLASTRARRRGRRNVPHRIPAGT